MKTSAAGALVMYRLMPLITQPVPSGSPRVASADGSDPASGSVSANDAVTSPLAIRGSQYFCCSDVPPTISTWPAMPLLVPNNERSAGVVSRRSPTISNYITS
jgi:hypothetical protein